MGQRLPAILAGAGIAYTEINSSKDFTAMDRELSDVFGMNKIHAFLLSPALWEGSECTGKSSEYGVRSAEFGNAVEQNQEALKPTLTRYEIIKIIAPYLEGKVVVSNLGWPSKELYAIKHQPSNFYMLGSMGMATPIGLGIALSTEQRRRSW